MIALAIALLSTGSTPPPPSWSDSVRPAAVETVSSDASASTLPSAVSVRLRCTAYGDGHVGGCTVLEESRPGLGFGRAAVALMEMSGVEPDRHEDHPVDVTFEHTIEFTP